MIDIQLYNTLNRRKEILQPLQPNRVGIYACGPTVYDRIHVGNARPLVVFDVLVRLLRYRYDDVRYVRNITDVDDKINQRAAETGISIGALCETTIESFHTDAAALSVMPPDIEPRATAHISQMIEMIEKLIEKGFAYAAEGHVLFSVSKMPEYGALSGRSQEEMLAGARVEVAPYKQDPADFVLWKPADASTPGWESPWGRGRPGWHIECSAMSAAYLGEKFDIHAGGLDLIFPHHENEIAQSCCAHGTDKMAQIWVHNGYVTVEGEKMSKSLGNFTTVSQALEHNRGEVIRFALLGSHYRAPFDFSQSLLKEARQTLDKFYRAIQIADAEQAIQLFEAGQISDEIIRTLSDDLNSPACFAELHKLAALANKGSVEAATMLQASGLLLGLLQEPAWFKQDLDLHISADEIETQIAQRQQARANRDFARADEIRDKLADQGIRLLDGPDGTSWEQI